MESYCTDNVRLNASPPREIRRTFCYEKPEFRIVTPASPGRGYLRLLGGAVSSAVAARRLLGESDSALRDIVGACEGAGLNVRAGGALIVGPDGAGGAGENRLKLGADRLKLGSAELGAAVRGVNVLGVYDLGSLALGAGALGAAVRGVNVLGVYDGGVVALGAAVESCGQVERENLISCGGAMEVVRGVGVSVTLGVSETVGVVTVRGVKLFGVRLLGALVRGPAVVEPPGKTGCCRGATCGWNVLCCRVEPGPAGAGAEPEAAGEALSRLSRSFRITSRRVVTAASISGADDCRDTLPAPNPWSVRGPDEAVPAGEVAPNAGLTTPAGGFSAVPPEPTLRRLSTSMYASRRCWSWSWALALVMPLGEVLNVLPARPTAGAAWADIPPVVSVRPGLCKAVARVAPAPAAVVSALRLRSTGPCCPSCERSVDRPKLRPLRAAAIWCDTLGRHGLTMPPDANDRSDGDPPCAKNRESECLGKFRS